MNIEVSRRHFMKLAGAGVAGSAIAALGFGEAEATVAAHVRAFKLAKVTETRNTCPYCSVGVRHHHVLQGRLKKGEKAEIIHIEGDSDHPTNRGTLCPKGAALLDFVHSEDAAQVSDDPQAGLGQVRARVVGRRARSHRATDEGRPRQEFHRQEQRRRHGQPLDDAPASSPRRRPPTKRRGRPTRSCAAPGCWHSTTKRAFDTARRWPVWPQHSAVVR